MSGLARGCTLGGASRREQGRTNSEARVRRSLSFGPRSAPMSLPASSGQPHEVAAKPSEAAVTVGLLHCQFCGRALDDELFVNPAGELIGCPDCADARGLAGEALTLDEWNTPASFADVLAQYGIAGAEVAKP